MKSAKPHPHFKYNYALSGLNNWLKGFSSHLKIKPEDNRIDYPQKFGTGFAKVYNVNQV